MAIRRAYTHFGRRTGQNCKRLPLPHSWQFISHPRFKRWVGVLMMGTLLLLLIIGFLSPIQVADANDDVFDSGHVIDVASEGLESNCLDYCFTGVCVWLICTTFGCDIETSPRIKHHLPDLVVTAHRSPGDIPWDDGESVYGSSAKSAASTFGSGGYPTVDGGSHHVNTSHEGDAPQEGAVPHQNIFFKDVSVLGSPASTIFGQIDVDYLCPSQTNYLTPHFLSEYDSAGWRRGAFFGPESIYLSSFVPGMREVGSSAFNSWGPVHPRHGFIHTNEEPKGAAVLAQRGVDIMTRENQPHIYNRLKPDTQAQAIGLVISESNEDTDHWQMLSPDTDGQCDAFGQDTNYAIDRSSQSGNYGWLYWPEYACCVPKNGALLYYFDTEVNCPAL